ncbi:XS domain protein [Quillaja saponaria]|uniref:XS domain protein n=1 Tax=Quillaja saponaria TaxID=32244 RepID=A0AAD7Q4V5_QUISA|nr:XS domain protein [Quillaja saponaria]
MHSRRHEEHATVSPAPKLRAQHRLEVGSGPYRKTHHDGFDRSPIPKRSLSPPKLDGLRKGVGVSRKSDSYDRRDYDWHLGGVRTHQIRSRSPPIEQARKRPHFDEGVIHKNSAPPLELRSRYELPKTMEYNIEDENPNAKHEYGYAHVNSKINKKKDCSESRSSGVGRGMLDHKLMINEDELHESYRLPPDKGLTSYFEETGGHQPLLSRTVDTRRIDHERLQHQDPLPSDKLPVTEYYEGREKPLFHTMDRYCVASDPYSKDFVSTSQFRDSGSSSTDMLSRGFLYSHRDDTRLLPSNELSRSSGKLTEAVRFDGYGQRPLVINTRLPEGKRIMECYQQREYSPTRSEHEEYFHSKSQDTSYNELGYRSDDLYRRMHPHARVNYEQAEMEYDNRDSTRSSILHPVVDRIANVEDSYVTHGKGTIHVQPSLQKQKILDYPDMIRTSIASKQGEEYPGSGYSHSEASRKMYREYDFSNLGASEADRMPAFRSESGFRRDAVPRFQQERFQSSVSKYDSETYRHSPREQGMKEELGVYESDRLLKRRYNVEEETNVHDPRKIILGKQKGPKEFRDRYDSCEEWIDDEDISLLYSSGKLGFDREIHRNAEGEYNGQDGGEDFESNEWFSSQNSLAHPQGRSVGYHKHGGRYVKGHQKSSSLSLYKSQHFYKRSVLHKHPKVQKQNYGYDEKQHSNNDELSGDWENLTESEPSEGSEEFKQMVHEAFLVYSKKLSVNRSVQRRYKEQGKSGSLYCIVCGRSLSKEFMDTQRLVNHAFMSRKIGLRAKHLGLHRAICVLLGWDTVVPHDTITWVPHVLPDAEALAQKEDLILWPPSCYHP